MQSNTTLVSLGLVINRKRVPPIIISRFRSAIDAEEPILREWYVERFLTLRDTAFRDPRSYFNRYAKLSDKEATEKALSLWTGINLVNLEENILPTRPRATLILKKGSDHIIETVQLRRL